MDGCGGKKLLRRLPTEAPIDDERESLARGTIHIHSFTQACLCVGQVTSIHKQQTTIR